MDEFIKRFEELKAEYLLTLDDDWQQLVSDRQFADMRLTQFLDWLRAKQDKAWQPVEWHKRQWEL